jgi:hypothetical protein
MVLMLPAWLGAGEPAATAKAATAPDPAIVRQVRAHVTFLADDLMEGRGAGTRGHALAMNYVAAQFTRLGIEAAGDQQYFQTIAMRETRTDIESGQFIIRHASGDTTLAPINDMLVSPSPGNRLSEVTAPAVFVGFGIHAPEFKYDDFAGGVDVRGKIAVVLAGSPAALPATARAHYSREKNAELARRGAVGIVSVQTPVEERRQPWAFAANNARFPAMRLVGADGALFEAYPELRARAGTSRAAATALFKHAPKPAEQAFAASERSEPQSFPLNVDLSLSVRAEVSDVRSANVLGWLPGHNRAVEGEPIVITSHLDHQGIGPAVDGDTIYNGALDNAMGTAIVLAVAEQLAAGPRLRRPVLFASVTAEEKGLLGASHLARHPPKQVRRYAANLNIDMPILLAPIRDVVGIGAEHTTLGAKLGIAAGKTGFTVSPDPAPDEVVFVRSDQYQFVRAGVPALYLVAGRKALSGGNEAAERAEDFRKTRYHKPSDDLSQPIDWPSAAAFAQMAAELVRIVSEDPAAPAWQPGDFFGRTFATGK